MKVKILGAGSIGNHLAQAARRMGWDVTIVDKDPEALRRMREDIYPTRYGSWDEAIKLCISADEPKNGFDVICIGTPPHVRMPLALAALRERPKVLLLEKPLCQPTLDGLHEFLSEYREQKETIAIVGYDHALSPSIQYVVDLLKQKDMGDMVTLDVEFREHWGGIFKAHPWLSGPKDSYLGFTAKGGGASGEHSHALHLWQYLAKEAGLGSWKNMSVNYDMHKDKDVEYDKIASFVFTTENGKLGRVIQDVVTSPTRKWARIQGTSGFIEWICNGHADGDVVRHQGDGSVVQEKVFTKKRPDDFYQEMLHIKNLTEGDALSKDSPVSLEGALSVMSVLAAAYKEIAEEGVAIPQL